jgi:hypothetical protein
MRMFQKLVLGMGAAVMLTPGIAFAGDTVCIWRALPAEVRAAAVKAVSEGRDSEIFQGVDPELLGKAMLKCVTLPSNERQQTKAAQTVGFSMGVYAAQLNAEDHLQNKMNVEPDTLNQAYNRVQPKLRRELGIAIRTDKRPSAAVTNALVNAMMEAYPTLREIGTDGPEFGKLMSYFAARALREEAEAQF